MTLLSVRSETVIQQVPAVTITCAPFPKPRMTAADRWKRRPVVLRYWEWCARVREACERRGFLLPSSGLRILFAVPMPESWSKKKRSQMNGQPHQQRPDVDNYVKAVFDALSEDDSHIWQFSAEKRWTDGLGSIQLEVVQ